MWSSVYNLCLYKAQFPEKRHCPSHLLHAVTSVFNLSDCPSHDSLGRTQQKLHPKLVNDCLLVRLHHRLSNLSTGEANLQPSLFTGVMRGHRHVTCGLVMTDSAKDTQDCIKLATSSVETSKPQVPPCLCSD